MRPFCVEDGTSLDSISIRIASYAAAAPNDVAVVDSTTELTYGELERESNWLCTQLRLAGAAPDRCVGLFTERSVQAVIAALAVLKSGAAYVPIDPSTPIDRLQYILADADAIAVLTSSSNIGMLPKGPWQAIIIDSVDSSIAPRSFSKIEPCKDSIAYIIYTSGSTGRPKGVEITHANLLNLIDWHQRAFGVTPVDRASQVAALGFDASVWEIWPYLTAGATLHIADESTRRSAQSLRDWIVSERITIGFVPTALAEQLFQMTWPAATALRILLTGGDTLRRRPPSTLPFVVVNNYGPTECTVVATSGIVQPNTGNGRLPSIGHPITNATALILDESLRMVESGEIGELCLGGVLVGRGYRNLPELTANRFVSYLSGSGESLRIYRTGDRARFQEDGQIEFIGRLDDQVKIRGYRIELGEIAACLNCCPGIEAATVMSVDVNGHGTALAAYVVVAKDAKPTERDLRAFLATRLPDYMIPAFFVSVPSLPLTASGKIDRSALPPPGLSNPLESGTAANCDSSQNCIQQQMAELVAGLLKRPAIGPDENFFMVGGHSMLGVQLVAQIRERFGVNLTLRQLFTAPTVAALSGEVARLTGGV